MEIIEFLAIETGIRLSDEKLLELINICKFTNTRELKKKVVAETKAKIKAEFWELRKKGKQHNEIVIKLAKKYDKKESYISLLVYS